MTRVVLALTAGVLLTLLTACDLFVDAGTRIARAEKHIAATDYRSAMIELRQALEDEPKNAHAHLLLAETAWQLGDAMGADEELRRAWELGSPPAASAELAARIRLAVGDYPGLLAQIASGKIQLPQPARAVYRGQALHGLKREDEAVLAYREALASDAGSAEAQTGLAEVHAAQGDFTRALAETEAVTARHPTFAYAWLVRGSALARRGQFAPAEQALTTALQHAAGQLNLQQRAAMLATLTQAKLARGDVPGATAAQQQLAELTPDTGLVRFMSARIAIARQDYPAAIAELQQLLNTTPEFLPARFLLGGALLTQGSLEQAEQQLAQVVRETPANLEARKLLAQVRVRAERPQAAMEILVPALEGKSADPQVRALLNAAQAQLGDDAASIDFLERNVASHPANDDLKLSLATAYLKSGKRDKAIELLNRTAGQSRLALARFYLQEKQIRKAEQIIAQVTAASQDRADIFNLVGLLYLEAGHYDRALAQLRAAADKEPSNPGYWFNVARVQMVLQQPAAAREALDKALALRPDWQPAVGMAAMLDLGAGHADAAVARIVALKQKYPRDAQVLLLEGEIRAGAKQYGAAAEAFEAAGRLRPSAMAALKAYTARQLGKLPDPADPLKRWLERDPADLAVRFALAEAYSAAEPAKAIAEYEKIVHRTPRNAIVLNNLAWLYHTGGDERALQTAQQAHALAPKAPAIADTYGWILLQKGRVTEALPILKTAAAAGDPAIQAHYAEALKRSANSGRQS